MSLNFLKLNESKTEIIVFGSSDVPNTHHGNSSVLFSSVKSCVKNLGVLFDSALKFDRQINLVVKSCFYQLRALAKVKTFLSFKHFETAIHAFISFRLDYCNSLYLGINSSSISRLQMVQNAAARLLTGVRKHEHITSVLRSLHWLPVRFRIDFKVLMLVFKCLNGLAPSYLSDLCEYHPERTLRSANQSLLTVPKSKLKSRGDRAFAIAAPKLWNKLPIHIKTAPTLHIFKSKLKTYLFNIAYDS
ncbi:putative RNA-directed DNA polymerase from transposon BS [Labeo rohita]|uniref:RNA-directed DNA polymerase from transposon BS n=1 Tax=Labeo rohita TaxID=84645 RepID=A0ABQ8LCT2_LABRO|nr:putative RNA-directed DNA polymerase from transposon BS [Labeo rohita]